MDTWTAKFHYAIVWMRTIIVTTLLALVQLGAYCQETHIIGKWILDYAQYKSGTPLEINHRLFSQYIDYEFDKGSVKINGQTFEASFDAGLITTDFRTLAYRIDGQYLIITEKGDDKEFYFLTKDNFLNRYPEFEARKVEYQNDTVFEANSIVKPYFRHPSGLDIYLRDRIPSFSKTSATNDFFKAQFVLTADNQIKNVSILNSISKTFDKQFIKALNSAQKHFVNDSDKDLLITQQFNFFKMHAGLTSIEEKKMYEGMQKAEECYSNQDFENAILVYSQLLGEDIDSITKERWKFKIDDAYINLGISFLVTGSSQKACEAFSGVGDKTNFKVRNYLIKYCE